MPATTADQFGPPAFFLVKFEDESYVVCQAIVSIDGFEGVDETRANTLFTSSGVDVKLCKIPPPFGDQSDDPGGVSIMQARMQVADGT